MIRPVFKQSAVALCAAALAALAPLAAAGPASAQMRPHSAVHAAAGAPMHHAMMRPTGRWMHAGATFRGGDRFASTRRSFGGRFVVADRGFGHRRFGWRGRFWRHRFFGVAGYPLYAYGYGYRRHSCWWYRHFDPVDMPAWCGVYGYTYTYGYEPDYAYGYGPDYGFGYSYGVFGHRFDRDRFHRRHFAFDRDRDFGFDRTRRFGGATRDFAFDRTRHFGFGANRDFGFGGATRPTSQFAFHGGVTRPMEGRAALVGGGQGGVHFQGAPHNFGGAGAAHFGGGAAHMGGAAHVGAPGGGHFNQH